MRDLWSGLSATTQDMMILTALLLPSVAVAFAILHGHAPFPIARAMMRRLRWTNIVFVLLIGISIGLGVGLIAQERGMRQGSARAAEKFDLIVSAPGSEITVMLATVFLQPTDLPLLDGAGFAEIVRHPNVVLAAPLGFGDSVDGAPVVGTTAAFIEHLSDKRLDGRMFTSVEEAVVGALSPLALGSVFRPQHGFGDGQIHDIDITVVGRLPLTGSPWDRAIVVPIESVWSTHGLADGHAPQDAGQLGPPFDPDYFPGTPSVIVIADQHWANYALRETFSTERMMAFFPGAVLIQLHDLLGDVRQVMSIMAVVTQGLVVAAVMTAVLLLVRIFRRQISILRALGAPHRFIFAVLWSYAATLILAGVGLGIVFGLAAVQVIGRVVTARTDILVTAGLGWPELHLIGIFTTLTLSIAIVPAWFAMRQPVLAGLR
ncbi:MAG: FtsX-like permease family protein [Pseudomonadota bacterium]